MKRVYLSLLFSIACVVTVCAQETYSYYYASYLVENGKREMMVCNTATFEWVNDKTSGVSGVNYIPEASFRNWLDTKYGSRATGRDFYPCTSAEQAIKYYKDFAATYQQMHQAFQNSAYCSSIYSISYEEAPPKTNTTVNNPGNDSYVSSGTTTNAVSNTSTETASQRQYREQQERNAEIQRQSEAESKEIVDNASELAGMVGNMMATNRADREKKLAKKAEAKAFEAQQKEKREQEIAGDKRLAERYSAKGDNADIKEIATLCDTYFKLENKDGFKKWVKKATNYMEAKLYEPAVEGEKENIYWVEHNALHWYTGDSSILDVLACVNDRFSGNFDDNVKWLMRYINYYENSSDAKKSQQALDYMHTLGDLYQTGAHSYLSMLVFDQSKMDIEKAIYWYTRVAEKNVQYPSKDAMLQLFYIYSAQLDGTKPFKDKAKAKYWKKKYFSFS